MSGHRHDHAYGHGHAPEPADFGRAFALGIVLNTGFVATEAAFGFFANPNLKPEESTGYDVGFEQPVRVMSRIGG